MTSFITDKEFTDTTSLVEYFDYNTASAYTYEEASIHTVGEEELEKLLTGGKRTVRPLSALVSTLVDSAHFKHENRNLNHPRTPVYDFFECKSQETELNSYKTQHSSAAIPITNSSSTDVASVSPQSTLLEVECQYDAAYHEGDIKMKHGVQVRPAPGPSLGPVAFLYRWYTKRNTQFARPPSPAELAGSPPVPPTDLLASDYLGSVQRHINRGPDPVMTLNELIDMLEDLDIVPQWLRRSDVSSAFKSAMAVPMPHNPNILRPAGPLPDEMRFPQFCDVMIRLAVAVAFAAYGSPLPPGGECVCVLLELLKINSRNILTLKNYLDGIARMVRERGPKKRSMKWIYVAQQVVWPQLQDLEVEAGWKVSSMCRPPPSLMSALMQYDDAATAKYFPDWRVSPQPSLHCGCMVVGELRCFRVVIRNRDKETCFLRLDGTSAPFLTLSYSQLPLATGMPRIIDVQVQPSIPGELCGSVDIYTHKKGGAEQVVSVPIYGVVGIDGRPPDVLSTVNAMRRFRSTADPLSRPHSAAMTRGRTASSPLSAPSASASRHTSRPGTACSSAPGRSLSFTSAADVSMIYAGGDSRPSSAGSTAGHPLRGSLPTAAAMAALLEAQQAQVSRSRPGSARPGSARPGSAVSTARSPGTTHNGGLPLPRVSASGLGASSSISGQRTLVNPALTLASGAAASRPSSAAPNIPRPATVSPRVSMSSLADA